MSPELAAIEAQLHDSTERASILVGALTPDELTRRPARGGWNIAECLAHLTLTTMQFLPLIDTAALHAPPVNGRRLKLDLLGRALLWMLEPPYRIKASAPRHLHAGAADPARVLAEFVESQEALDARLMTLSGLAIDRIKIISPVDARARYNVFSALHVIAAHQRRHLFQAEQLTLAFC